MTDLRGTLNFNRFDADLLPGAPATPMVSTDRVKRISDLVLAAMILTFASPLLLLASAAIALSSPGPVFTVRRRAGLGGVSIGVVKFRTRNIRAARADGSPEMSAVGRLLKSTGVEKLPQLFNVLRGEMSMVGPMPHSLSVDRYYRSVIPQYSARTRAKPGFTGLAQVNGLSAKNCSIQGMAERIADDNAYIDYWSAGLDFKILVRAAISSVYRTEEF